MSSALKTVFIIIAVVVIFFGVILFVPKSSDNTGYDANSSATKEESGNSSFYETVKKDDQRLRADLEVNEEVSVPEEELTFAELDEIEMIEAEHLFEPAMQFRKIGRLPGMSYKTMVDACKLVMEKFPGSEYDYKARRMLGDIPASERVRYKITAEDIDMGPWK